jgi:hypothetical protein
MFIEPLLERSVGLDIIAGNHDVYYKNTNDVNALEEIFEPWAHINIFTEPDHSYLLGNNFLYIPWINPENNQACMQAIEESNAEYCFAHLELSGFEMHAGNINEHGMSPKLFSKFKKVMTGHYHEKSTKGNIHYVSSPFEFTWADYNGLRGFHIFDTSTGNLEFIRNPYKLFHIVSYNDKKRINIESQKEYLGQFDLEDCYVKIQVEEKNNPYLFDLFMEEIEDKHSFDFKIIENLNQFYDDTITEEVAVESTETIINKTIDDIELSCDKQDLKILMSELYNRANLLESNDS